MSQDAALEKIESLKEQVEILTDAIKTLCINSGARLNRLQLWEYSVDYDKHTRQQTLQDQDFLASES